MAQNYIADCFGPSHIAQSDLQIMEDNFACLRSSFSGGGSPPVVTGQLWYDTDTGTLRVKRDPAWVGVMTGDANQKIWVYRNDAMPGWGIDATSSTDMVLALRGGYYGDVGGVNAGSNWDTNVHQHGVTIEASHFNHQHQWWSPTSGSAPIADIGEGLRYDFFNPLGARGLPLSSLNTTTIHQPGDYTGYTGSAATPFEWRPIAAVGTMQYVLPA